jgi:hypothetical protein
MFGRRGDEPGVTEYLAGAQHRRANAGLTDVQPRQWLAGGRWSGQQSARRARQDGRVHCVVESGDQLRQRKHHSGAAGV